MQKALLELHYWPCVQYFSKLLKYPVVVIEQWENYQKGSYRNRCMLAAANGPLRLSIPLNQGKNQQQSIREVRINYRENWLEQHWRSIQSAYGKSPFFEHYADELRPLYTQKPQFLFDWNQQLLEIAIELLDLPVQLDWSSSYHKEKELPEDCRDLRNRISSKEHLAAEDPHFKAYPYSQAFAEKSGFLANLSILDLLFCTGPQAIQILEASTVD